MKINSLSYGRYFIGVAVGEGCIVGDGAVVGEDVKVGWIVGVSVTVTSVGGMAVGDTLGLVAKIYKLRIIMQAHKAVTNKIPPIK